MQNKYIITPFFLDEPINGLDNLVKGVFNQPELTEDDTQASMSFLYKPLAAQTGAAVREGERPVSIAGDCCTTVGVLAGLQKAEIDPLLIWFDAHGDFNTWETTPSGFLGGMPLAMLVGRGEQRLMRDAEAKPLKEAQVILTDGRDLDPEEAVAVAGSDIVHLKNVTDLLKHDLGERPIWVHFDTDVVDPADAPAMNYPTPSGPSIGDIKTVFKHLADTERVAAVSMSTWNPEMEGAKQSQEVCIGLLGVLLGGN